MTVNEIDPNQKGEALSKERRIVGFGSYEFPDGRVVPYQLTVSPGSETTITFINNPRPPIIYSSDWDTRRNK